MRIVDEVRLRRAEGPSAECTDWTSFPSFFAANNQLRTWAETAPTSGYDKCDFVVVYKDGEDPYEGRFDLQRWHKNQLEGLLQRHILEFLAWYFDVADAL